MEFLKQRQSRTGPSRRHFLILTALAASCLSVVRRMWPRRSVTENKIKLLTHDGKLVEVDSLCMPKRKKAVNKQQLVSWVWKDQKL